MEGHEGCQIFRIEKVLPWLECFQGDPRIVAKHTKLLLYRKLHCEMKRLGFAPIRGCVKVLTSSYHMDGEERVYPLYAAVAHARRAC